MSLRGFEQPTSFSPRSANSYDSSLNDIWVNQHEHEECFHCLENHPNRCDMHRTASLGYGNEEPTAQAQWLLRGYSGHRYQGTEYLNRQYNLTVDIPNAQGAMDTTGLQSGLESFSPAFSPTPSTASVVTPRSTASYKPYGGLDPVIYTGASPSDLSGFNLQYGDPSHIIQGPASPASGFRMQVGSPAAAGISKSHRTKNAAYFCPYPGCNSEGFTEKHNLNYHINSHCGIKPHVCPNCKRGFGSKSDLSRHLKAKSLPCGNAQAQTIGN